MQNRFASFKPTVDQQQSIQQPQKQSEVKAKTEKFEPRVEKTKNVQAQQVKKIAEDEFDGEYQMVSAKTKQGGAAAKRQQDGGPKRINTTDRRPDDRGKAANRQKFQGKPREEGHPMDRRSGTGRGREIKKGGQGRGNWGNENTEALENKDTKVAEAVQEEETKDEQAKADAEMADASKNDKKAQQEPEEEEEEETGMSLDEFLASKKKSNIKGQKREGEKVNAKNLQADESDKVHQETIKGQIKDAQMYNPLKSDNVELFGFQGGDDDMALQRTRTKGGRKHKKPRKDSNAMQVDEDNFPSFQ